MRLFERNRRVVARYDELMHEGKHGHYETMFRVVHEEVQREGNRAELLQEDIDSLHMCLDDMKAPRELDGKQLSLWGRIQNFVAGLQA